VGGVEMETKFKVGDEIKIIEEGICVDEINHGKGMLGIIVKISGSGVCKVSSKEFRTFPFWYFSDECLCLHKDVSLLNDNVIKSTCPQCNGELIDKYSEWAGKDIKKCKTCGWC
jgi:hypothetical protein